MTRQTSIEIYREIESNGLLSKRRWEVYQLLYKYGPATCNELFEKYKQQYHPNFKYNMNLHSRLGELRKQNAVIEVGNKICDVNGNNKILWDVTNKRPIPFKRESKPSYKQLENALKEIADYRRLRPAGSIARKVLGIK